jgi:hypothetical protein
MERTMPVDLKKLTAPFPREAIKQRQGGGSRMLSYVEGHTVVHRLNDACGEEGWSFAILKEWQDGDILKALVELTLPGLGSRQHIGVQKITANGGEDLHKGAVTDGLKKAATLFGVGLELYGPDYEDDAQPARSATPAPRVGQPGASGARQSIWAAGQQETPRQQVARQAESSGDAAQRPEWMKAREAFRALYKASGKSDEAAEVYGWISRIIGRDVRSLGQCSEEDFAQLTRALQCEKAPVP